MIHKGIEYVLRASLGRDRWAVLVYFPDNADGLATVSQFCGTKYAAEGWAQRLIDNWLQRQQSKKLSGAIARSTSTRRPGARHGTKAGAPIPQSSENLASKRERDVKGE